MSTSISNSNLSAVNNEHQNFSGQKRRPIDPPEDDVVTSSSATTYDSELMHQHKRPRTIDELGLSFSRNSLSAPDPPGNYSAGSKRKNDIEDCPKAKIPRTEVAVSSSSSDTRQQEQQQNLPIDPPSDRNDVSPTNVTSELYASTQLQQQDANSTNPNEHEYRRNSSEMSIDDDENNNNSDHDSCDGSSVSESSIRDAMYQLVFGRRQAMPSIGNGSAASGATNYDAVDNKIEQLIRRSRMEATIKGQKSQKQEDSNMDNDEDDDVMKMDENDDNIKGAREYEDDDEWHPGHG